MPQLPLDPELAAALAAAPKTPPINADTLQITRERVRLMSADDDTLSCGGRVVLEERSIPGPPGAPELMMLVLRPARGSGPWPAIYHTHGGGMILGHRRLGITTFDCHNWVHELGLVLLSVEYRLAPEHPYPASVEDCYAG